MDEELTEKFHYHLPPDQMIPSPYLPSNNVNLNDDGYIYFNADKPVRGRLEHSFFEIGMAVMTGGGLGSLRGYVEGRREAVGYPHKLRNVVLLNHIVKRSSLGNSFGIVATIYATVGIAISELRGAEDDGPTNSLVAATITGLLYRLPGGALRTVQGGIAGATMGTLLAVWQGGGYITHQLKSSLGFA